jgi:nucleoside-diphosphate-sugar epimerase
MSEPARPLVEEFADVFSGRRVLVTGATGFIGWHLCHELSVLGAEVHALARTATAASVPAGSKAWAVDMADIEALRQAMHAARPDTVFHLGSVVDARQDVGLVLPLVHSNLVAAIHLALVSQEVGRPRVVAVGSSEEPANDEVEAAPTSPYAAAKASATLYFRMFHRLYGLPVVILRPFVTYGPRQLSTTKLIPYTIATLLRGESPRLASGRRVCDFIFVEDVVRGLLKAGLSRDAFGRTLDLGTGVGTSIREVVELLAELSGSTTALNFGALPDRLGERTQVADVDPARRLLGWTPRWSLREGLGATIGWYRRHPVEAS